MENACPFTPQFGASVPGQHLIELLMKDMLALSIDDKPVQRQTPVRIPSLKRKTREGINQPVPPKPSKQQRINHY